MINRIHLEILRKVASTGSLTSAAEELCLTQSALSHSIKKLEKNLHINLWEKQGRKLCLTPAGINLLELANRVLPEIEHSEMLIRQIVEGKKGSLRIGMECHPCYRWLLKAIPAFLKAWPDVEIDIKQQFQFDGISALINHDIDLLITPDPIYREEILFIPVFHYELVLAFPANHEFKNKKLIEPADLSNQTLITYPVAKERLDIFSQFLNLKNYSPKKHLLIESTDIMLEMVSAGRGVTALPSWLIQQYSESLDLKCLKLGKNGINKEIFIAVREKDIDIEYLKGFINLAKKVNL